MGQEGEIARALIAAGRLAGQRGLLWGTGGNLSARLDGEAFLVTARGAALDLLEPTDLVRCPISDGAALPAEASSEAPLHRRVYQRRPDAGSVLHLSPPFATLAACADLDLPLDLVPESVLYLRRVARVPYLQPGGEDLARVAAEALAGADAAVLANHGAVTVGASAAEALRRMETLEFLARLVVTARGAGLALDGIGEAAAEALRRSVYGRGG